MGTSGGQNGRGMENKIFRNIYRTDTDVQIADSNERRKNVQLYDKIQRLSEGKKRGREKAERKANKK